jgi:para-nitrobenzyl esterase
MKMISGGRSIRFVVSLLVEGLLVALVVCALAIGTAGGARADNSLVNTSLGTVHGILTSNMREFLGVRYAVAPVGNLRWAPPQSPSYSSTTIQATQFGSPCAQPATPFGTAGTNEDCLFLNVYTPNPPGSRLPVIVWIHGGAFVAGEGSDYDPTAMVTKNKVIVVTINYRLGALGSLAQSNLTSNGASGNWGLMDQQLALKWVHQNIANFGGDPNNVTIAGQSAGGMSVCAQIASPSAFGLFAKAITQSGPCTFPFKTQGQAETDGANFAAAVGCSDQSASCLRSLPVQTILTAQYAVFTPGNFAALAGFAPNTGGCILPLPLATALTTGVYNHVPVLEGTDQVEGRLLIALVFDFLGSPLTAAQYPTALQELAEILVGQVGLIPGTPGLGNPDLIAQEIEDEYPISHYATPEEAFATVFGDSSFSCPARLADQLLSLSVPVFAYEFNDANAPMIYLPPVSSFPYNATHTTELAFLYNVSAPYPPVFTASELTLASTMKDYWTQFAKTANPNKFGDPLWLNYAALTDNFQSLVAPKPQLELNFSQQHHCNFWTAILAQAATGL